MAARVAACCIELQGIAVGVCLGNHLCACACVCVHVTCSEMQCVVVLQCVAVDLMSLRVHVYTHACIHLHLYTPICTHIYTLIHDITYPPTNQSTHALSHTYTPYCPHRHQPWPPPTPVPCRCGRCWQRSAMECLGPVQSNTQ